MLNDQYVQTMNIVKLDYVILNFYFLFRLQRFFSQ